MSLDMQLNDIVRILKYPENGINGYGRIDVVDDGRYWVTNLNMPFNGTVNGWFTHHQLKLVTRRINA